LLLAVLFAVALLIMCLPSRLHAAAEAFPLFPAVRPNVEFWEKVYATYTSRQGILHDMEQLDIIYGVIDLVDPDGPGARKINRKRIERAKNDYVEILGRLAGGATPASEEENRIAALFGPTAGPVTFRSAAHRIRCQTGQKDRFEQGLIRSGAYLDKIRNIFRQYGLPLDLVYLPHVESSFNPEAYSKFGAAGIWQFTRATGKRFMTIDYTVDERRDPILSTYAAAKLLKENHEKLGSWPLALTAYNHGVNGMLRAKTLKGHYEAIFEEYESRLFRFASRNFYSEFLAACKVAKNYRAYFGNILQDRPIDHPEIVLPGYVALRDLTEHLGIGVEDLRRLNPSLRKPVFEGEKYVPKGFRLRVPVHTAEPDRIIAAISPDLLKSQQKRSRFYRVEKGDTAAKVARMHGVSLKDFIQANTLDRRATIYPGQNLRLPGPAVAVAQASDGSELRERPPVPQDGSAPVKGPSASVRIEPEKPAFPAAEKAVRVETEPAVNPTLVVGDLKIQRAKVHKGVQVGVIRVAAEETIGHYADWLNVPARDIRRLNRLQSGSLLRINQEVTIPLHRISKERFEEKRFEYHEEIVQDFFNAYRVDQIQTYHIRKGDNIWTLCSEVFDVPLWLFQAYNAGLDLNALQMTQSVRIPIVEPKKESDTPQLVETEQTSDLLGALEPSSPS